MQKIKELYDNEEKLLKLSNEILTLSQKNLIGANRFVRQAVTCMVFNREFDCIFNKSDIIRAYETLLLYNLSYNNYNPEEDKMDYIRNIDNFLGPYKNIDEEYYKNFLSDPLFLTKVYFMIKTSYKIDSKDLLLMSLTKNEHLLDYDKSFKTLENIIRTGWVIRNVDEPYRENDSTHIMQMFALASACFRLYNMENFDKRKVFDMILIHEIGEVTAGDISEIDPNHDNKHNLERMGVVNTFKHLNSGTYFIDLWDEFEQRKTREAKVVYQYDKIDPILKARFLDKVLQRDDLFQDFYSYEEKRDTFNDGSLKRLFKYMKR